jgi:hypothetical protein
MFLMLVFSVFSDDGNPIDISSVRTNAELDKYIGKQVKFSGEWARVMRDTSISNGGINVIPRPPKKGGYTIGEPITVVGRVSVQSGAW